MSRRRWTAGVAAAAAVAAACTVAVVETRGSADRTRPVAQASTPSASPSPASPEPPVSYRLRITKEYQAPSYDSSPAAGVVSLSTFGMKVRQSTLIRKMKSKPREGTDGDDIMHTLRDYLYDTPYLLAAEGWSGIRPDFLLRDVGYDVGVLRRAPVLMVWWERLPWNKGIEPGAHKVGHLIVAYGYDRAKGTVTVFDPSPDTGGTHTLPATTLARILQPGGLCYIYRQ
ncbi:hypothetical protein GCM10023196_055010 [Actinoallomurus vinaceus]|uniref:Peptidase C39-like domain-containing protein n=1 Tax=Actinoallomurus vinaceus TaxID=1080074 RepID=A0ABP8UHU0_9ACTN